MTHANMILETRGLTREFNGFTAVNGIDLRVRRGTIHALIGPNGAGKTTCFNLLTKFLTPTSGQISSMAAKSPVQRPPRSPGKAWSGRSRFPRCSRTSRRSIT